MAHGHPNWHDLNTRDPQGALAFYTALLPWTLHTTDDTPAGPYPILHDGQATFGGVITMDAQWEGLPPHWAHYFEVDDLDAAFAAATEAGGHVEFGPLPIPDVGRFGMVKSPLGAFAYLIEMDEASPPTPERPKPGQFCWMSLSTPDLAASKAFWAAVLGWTYTPMDMGGGVTAHIASAGEAQVADMDQAEHPEGAPAMWQAHVAVADLDATLAHATELGGTVLVPAMDLGTFGRMGIIQDPTGAMLPLFQATEG